VLGHLSVEDQIILILKAVRLRITKHRDCLQENSIFLFLLAPVDVSFRIFSIHLKPYKSGSADTEIQQLCAMIIDQLSANHSVDLTFISVDGDPGYQTVFDRQFERLLLRISLFLILVRFFRRCKNLHHGKSVAFFIF
jgi:hypothetical protein